jgi:flavin reductase (DIM6/NTAB) family NADH-FMN oxidoreductase RutF
MPTDWNTFREAMRRFATGVAIMTVRDGDAIHGMTANAFASVSKDPMLVLICVMKDSITHDLVSRGRNFALNILGAHQRYLAQRFAKQTVPPLDPFLDIQHHRAVTGAPIFEDCVSYVDCRVVAAHDGGDHTIFIGQVEEAGLGKSHDALLLWVHGDYHSVE